MNITARLKPQHPHTHRFRFERPDGVLVRGRCDCGAFRVQWADGNSPFGITRTHQNRGASAYAVAKRIGFDAWATVLMQPLFDAPEPERRPQPRSGSVLARLRDALLAAGGEFVPSNVLQEQVYGRVLDDGGRRIGADIANLRRKYGRDAIASQKGKGYAWKGTSS